MSLIEKLGKMGIPGFRSGKKWKMAIAIFGYFWILLILLSVIFPAPTTTTQNPQSLTTQSTTIENSYDVLPSIQDMPSGTRLAGEEINVNVSKRAFRIELTEIQYISTKFSTIEEAKSGFAAVKEQKSTKYKLDSVNVGDEAFLYTIAEYQKMLILRKSNVYVIVIGEGIAFDDDMVSYARLLKV